MDLEGDKVVGIVGGMGPQAGVALCNSLLTHTKATTDQQHLSLILISFPKHIVDRTAFLEGSVSVNPAFGIVDIINKLETAGARIIAIACNTSHAPEIYDVILGELDRLNSHVKLLHMPLETCRFIRQHHPTLGRIGVMTTNGSYKSGIYSKLLTELGYDVVLPDLDFQNNVIHKMIYDSKIGVKSNPNYISKGAKLLMDRSLDFFKAKGAEAIILGCTELPLITSPKKRIKGITIIDSNRALAEALVREANISDKRALLPHYL